MVEFWLSVMAAVTGLFYFGKGLRLHLVTGDEPRCGKCAYLLWGISSSRCPECGADLPDNLIHGQFRRSPRTVVLGTVLLLGGLLYLSSYWYPPFRTQFWYRHAPVSVLLWQQQLTRYDDVWVELRRRAQSGELHGEAARNVCDRALAILAANKAAGGPLPGGILQLLPRLASVTDLDAARREKACLVALAKLRCKLRHPPGLPPWTWDIDTSLLMVYGPRDEWFEIAYSYYADDAEKPLYARTESFPLSITLGRGEIVRLPPGTRTLAARYHIDWYLGQVGNKANSTLLASTDRVANVTVPKPLPAEEVTAEKSALAP